MNAQASLNSFATLAAIDVNKYVEKKGGLSYLSWAWAVDQLMRKDPNANWEFHEPTMFGETMMVSCTVTAFNKPITMHLPVMDHKNQAIKNPDAFQVNKNMMRCLVKAIACHGLGLALYSGEDLPSDSDSESQNKPAKAANQPAPLDEVAAIKAMRGAATLELLEKFYQSAMKRASNEQATTIQAAYEVAKEVLAQPQEAA